MQAVNPTGLSDSSKRHDRQSQERNNGKTTYWLTLKCNNGRRVMVEIEEKLDKRDFDDLWELSMNRLEKTRYKMPDGWCVDFFLDHDDAIYFVMAECEMPEEQLGSHKWVPDVITKSLAFAVPTNDPRFFKQAR